jgi:predicted transcriptional regulator YdeE
VVIEKEIQARNFSSLDSFCLLTAIYISEHHTEEGAMGHHVGVLGHAQVTVETGVEFYFVPHHPWQCGTNENTGERRVQEVYNKLNRRPRKRLGYRTPYEVHCSKTLHLI